MEANCQEFPTGSYELRQTQPLRAFRYEVALSLHYSLSFFLILCSAVSVRSAVSHLMAETLPALPPQVFGAELLSVIVTAAYDLMRRIPLKN